MNFISNIVAELIGGTSKQAYLLRGKPTHCKHCGGKLKESKSVVEYDEHTSLPTTVSVHISCPNTCNYSISTGSRSYQWYESCDK